MVRVKAKVTNHQHHLNNSRKTGWWCVHDENDGKITAWECSLCGTPFDFDIGGPSHNLYYFCPSCGALMEGEDIEDNSQDDE